MGMDLALALVAFLQAQSLDEAAKLWGDASADAREEGTRLVLRRWAEWTDQDLARLKALGDNADSEISSRARAATSRIAMRRKLGAPIVLRLPQADATILSKEDAACLQLLKDAATEWERLALREDDLERLAAALAGHAWRPEGVESLLSFLGETKIDAYGPLAAEQLNHPDPGTVRDAAAALSDLDPRKWADAIASLLASPSNDVRLRALEVLGQWRWRSKSAAVAPLLESGSIAIRRASLEALERMGAVDQAPKIAALLKDPDEDIAGKAASTLGEIGATAFRETLLDALADPRSRVQMGIGDALRKLGLGESTERVARMLDHRDAKVRLQAAHLLSTREPTAALIPVRKFLDDRNPDLRCFAVSMLREPRQITPYLHDPEEKVRDEALNGLMRLGAGPAAADEIVRALDGFGTFSKSKALRALAHPDAARHADKVAPFLSAPDRNQPFWSVKGDAINCLARMGATAHAGAIAGLLKDPEPRIRTAAANALARLQSRSHIGALFDLYRKEPNLGMGEAERFLVSERRAEMLAMIDSEDPKVSSRACELFPADDSGALFPVVAPMLQSPRHHVRRNVIRLMGRWGDPRALPLLVPLLTDADGSLRIAAAHAVAGPGARSHLDKLLPFLDSTSMTLRRTGISVVARTAGMDQAPKIASFLTDPDPDVRLAAVYALADLGATEYAGAIAARVHDPAYGVWDPTIYVLIGFGPGAHLDSILPLLGDPRRQRSVLFGLERANAPQHAARVAELLADVDPWVRTYAAKALLRWDPARWMTPALQVLDLPSVQQPSEVLHPLADIDWTALTPEARARFGAKLEALAKEGRQDVRDAALLPLYSLGLRPLPPVPDLWHVPLGANDVLLRALAVRHHPETWSKLRRVEKLDRTLNSPKDFTDWMTRRGLTLFRSNRLRWNGRLPEGLEISPLQILERMGWMWGPYVQGQTVTLLGLDESHREWEQRLAK